MTELDLLSAPPADAEEYLRAQLVHLHELRFKCLRRRERALERVEKLDRQIALVQNLLAGLVAQSD